MSNQNDSEAGNSTQNTNPEYNKLTCALTPQVSLHPGMTCPRCGQGIIDYDGLLQLVCPVCGLTEAGAST
jgi:uncharacterized protein (DUF983 family)